MCVHTFRNSRTPGPGSRHTSRVQNWDLICGAVRIRRWWAKVSSEGRNIKQNEFSIRTFYGIKSTWSPLIGFKLIPGIELDMFYESIQIPLIMGEIVVLLKTFHKPDVPKWPPAGHFTSGIRGCRCKAINQLGGCGVVKSHSDSGRV